LKAGDSQADREELRDATKDHDDTNAKVDDAAARKSGWLAL
jgi:hypothetical protein